MVFRESWLNFFTFIGAVIIITASLFWRPLGLSQEKLFLPPPSHLEYFSFGQQMFIADSLWLRAIQDFDFCENQLAKNLCQGNSWLYQMLNSITNLAPDYLTAYREGGLSLSVIISDIEGSSRIFDKGVKVFPKDFNLLYRAAYHALFEEKNKKKAADLFVQAGHIKGLQGDWFYSLATRLYVDSNYTDIAFELYSDMKNAGLDESFLKRMREKLGIQDK